MNFGTSGIQPIQFSAAELGVATFFLLVLEYFLGSVHMHFYPLSQVRTCTEHTTLLAMFIAQLASIPVMPVMLLLLVLLFKF